MQLSAYSGQTHHTAATVNATVNATATATAGGGGDDNDDDDDLTIFD